MRMRRITLSPPEDLVIRARRLAAQRNTPLSTLVGDLLRQVIDQGTDYDSIWAAEERVMREGIGLEVGPLNWTRAEAHER